MVKAANHHQRQVQASVFKPWQRLTAQHTRTLHQGDAHYQRSVQRAACQLWLCRLRAVVAANEERLRGLEVRAVTMGERHLLRFWLVKWKHAHSMAREEKQMSATLLQATHTDTSALHCCDYVLTHWPLLHALFAVFVCAVAS